MPSAALLGWRTVRAQRLDQLRAAHDAVRASAWSGHRRRWVTEQLNHALILRLASEFRGFARQLYDDAVSAVVVNLAPNHPRRQDTLRLPYDSNRRLDRGNATPEDLAADFSLLGIALWRELKARYPRSAPGWNRKLVALNTARNGIVHDDARKIAQVKAAGWPLTLRTVNRWRSALNGLTLRMDQVISDHLRREIGTPPW